MPKQKVNKQKLIENHLLLKKKITTWEAISLYMVTRLSGTIHVLRKKGWKISSKQVTKNGLEMAEYKLLENPKIKEYGN